MIYYIDTSDKRLDYVYLQMQNLHIPCCKFEENNINLIVKNDKIIFAPSKKFDSEFLLKLPNNIELVAGNIKDDLLYILEEKQIKHNNIMKNELFTLNNAQLTAEGVLSLIIEKSPKSMYENNILLLGGGRITKSCGVMFAKLGLKFAIMSFNPKEVIDAHYLTNKCYLGKDYLDDAKNYDIVINTIPIFHILDEDLDKFQENSIYIETASYNGLNADKITKFNFIHAPALPLKYTIESAGKLILNYILEGNK